MYISEVYALSAGRRVMVGWSAPLPGRHRGRRETPAGAVIGMRLRRIVASLAMLAMAAGCAVPVSGSPSPVIVAVPLIGLGHRGDGSRNAEGQDGGSN